MIRYYEVEKKEEKNPTIVMRPLAIIIHKWKTPIFHFMSDVVSKKKKKNHTLGKCFKSLLGEDMGANISAVHALCVLII